MNSPHKPRFVRSLLALALWAGLAGCWDAPDQQPTDADLTRAEALRPADGALAAKYERACMLCHATRGAAPLAGFGPAWAKPGKQGEEVLLAHVREGFNAMPVKGLCIDCSDDELRALIRFMSRTQ